MNAEKKVPAFQRFLYWFLIPFLFISLIIVLIASLSGFNIFQKAKDLSEKLPFIEKVMDQNEEDYLNQIIELDAEIQNKEAEIERLSRQLETMESEKESLLLEKQQLEEKIEELLQVQENHKREFKDIISTFEAMSPKKTVPIILNMKEEEALKILANLNTESLAKILEQMPPKDAAEFTEKLTTR